MDDERTLPETDARVRDALLPDEAVTRRVLERAFASDRARAPEARRLRPVLTIAALALIVGVAGIGVWQSRRPVSAPVSSAPLALTGNGSIVVVEHPDGRRWIVGPPPERPTGGNYVIAVPK